MLSRNIRPPPFHRRLPMKLGTLLLVALVSAGVAYGTLNYVNQNPTTATPATKETRLDQIKRTGTLRCGYQVWPPMFVKDPNTGKMSGLYYDLVEEIGRQLKIKIEWTAEIATGQMLSDLNMNRYDAVCGYFGRTPSRAREAGFTMPLFYVPIYMYVRADDTRFDRDVFSANKPDVKFATLDGEFSSIAANESFPDAARVSVPQMSTAADLFMIVSSKKADAVIQDSAAFSDYDTHNPGILRPAS